MAKGIQYIKMRRYSQRGRMGSGLEGLAPSMWAADALFLCGSWASCQVLSANLHF